jgi:hypothetical protein
MNNAKINYIMLIIIISLKLNWIYNTNCPKHLNFFIVVLFMQLSNHCLEPVNIVSAFRLTLYREPPGLFGACLRHSAMLSSILSSVAFLWHLIQESHHLKRLMFPRLVLHDGLPSHRYLIKKTTSLHTIGIIFATSYFWKHMLT